MYSPCEKGFSLNHGVCVMSLFLAPAVLVSAPSPSLSVLSFAGWGILRDFISSRVQAAPEVSPSLFCTLVCYLLPKVGDQNSVQSLGSERAADECSLPVSHWCFRDGLCALSNYSWNSVCFFSLLLLSTPVKIVFSWSYLQWLQGLSWSGKTNLEPVIFDV